MWYDEFYKALLENHRVVLGARASSWLPELIERLQSEWPYGKLYVEDRSVRHYGKIGAGIPHNRRLYVHNFGRNDADIPKGSYVVTRYGETVEECLREPTIDEIIQHTCPGTPDAVVAAYTKYYVSGLRYQSMPNLCNRVRLMLQPDTTEPRVSLKDITKEQVLLWVFGTKANVYKGLWGNVYQNDGIYFVFDDKFDICRTNRVKSGYKVLPSCFVRKTHTWQDVVMAVFSLYFNDKLLREPSYELLFYEEGYGGLTKDTWVRVLAKDMKDINRILRGEFAKPLVLHKQAVPEKYTAEQLYKQLTFLRCEVLRDGLNNVDGFVVECSAHSALYKGDMPTFANLNKRAIIGAVKMRVRESRWYKEHPEVDELLFASSFDITRSGYMTLTIAIKGGNISHK